jgi:UDP-N-acetylmuramate dehydrogenase
MSSLADFSDITRPDELLAPFTWLKVGGPAQYLIEPRHPEELVEVVNCCAAEQIPVRVLGGGSNLLVRDEGVSGVVLRLSGEAFARIDVDGNTIRSGAGALLSQLISRSVKAELAGLEVLAGIPGTVGGALRGNAGGRSGDIGQFVNSVKVLTAKGEVFTRSQDELLFSYRQSNLDEMVILEGVFELHRDQPDEIVSRMLTIGGRGVQ